MSSEFKKEYFRIMSDAFHECNEIMGYEYFRPAQINKITKAFSKLFPLVEELILKPRGVTIRDVETEQVDYERGKRAALMGILDGYVLKEYEGHSFKEKYKNYIYDPGITGCKWIQSTDYDRYLQTLFDTLLKIGSNKALTQFVFNYKSKKLVSISQGIVRIFRKKAFFRDAITQDEKTIDETQDYWSKGN
jgi:hypothetical protein